MKEEAGAAKGKERRVTFRMEGGDYDALCERCERAGLSKSEYLRYLVRILDWQHLFGRFREGQPRLPELDRRHVAQRRVDPEVVVPVHVVRELGP